MAENLLKALVQRDSNFVEKYNNDLNNALIELDSEKKEDLIY